MTATLTTAELNTFLNDDTRDRLYQRTLSNIARRAGTLLQDGYRIEASLLTGLFHCYGPQGQHYTVICDDTLRPDCDCPAYAKFGTCKHYLAVELMARDERQAAEHDALYADADADRYPEL